MKITVGWRTPVCHIYVSILIYILREQVHKFCSTDRKGV